jgi:glycerol-3-phosphate acyltransferase PlsY
VLADVAAVAAAYAVGSIPVAYLAGRWRGVDLREAGSGNVGASNVWQTVSRAMVVPVGLAQIGQGAAAVLLAHSWGRGDGVQAACAVAAVLAHDWNPWLRLSGGRGIGQSIGAVGVLSPPALLVFIAISVGGVAARVIPQAVALALIATPFIAAATGERPAVVAACAALAVIALAKRLLANGPPDGALPRPEVWWNRLLLDRDMRDREAWVRRRADQHGGGEEAGAIR